MKPIQDPGVARRFAIYPAKIRRKLMTLRAMILKTAAATDGVGALHETLKWGEPAYVTAESRSGSTIRIDWKEARPTEYAMYFNCKTNLIDTFRTLFPNDFRYQSNRAIVFDEDDIVSTQALEFCIAAALTYHRAKPGKGSRGRADT